MPRLGEEPSSRHQRVFAALLVAVLFTACLFGLAQSSFEAPLVSFRDWATTLSKPQSLLQPQSQPEPEPEPEPEREPDSDANDDVDAQGRRTHRKFADLTMMERLPRDVIPTARNGRRLIIIGDIHGMDRALDRLLEHVGYDGATDHIVSAGDMVNKGPHSARVVARLMELGASAVRGNHEDRVLLALASAAEQREAGEGVAFPGIQVRHSKKRDRKTARQLSPEQVKWLADRPLILAADDLAMYVVHAGLVPGIRPLRQDPWAVMNMRSLIEPSRRLVHQVPGQDGNLVEDEPLVDEDGDRTDAQTDADEDAHASRAAFEDLIPVDTHQGREWAELWDLRQSQIPKSDRRTVVYGHDAKRGLTLGKHTFGLDSACVNGGQLTALVIHVSRKGHVKRNIRQVPCKKYKD
ncbi:hypothetical protein V2A60_010254 [Cordyceps javanica]